MVAPMSDKATLVGRFWYGYLNEGSDVGGPEGAWSIWWTQREGRGEARPICFVASSGRV